LFGCYFERRAARLSSFFGPLRSDEVAVGVFLFILYLKEALKNSGNGRIEVERDLRARWFG
jgi:hypothetical protein